MSAALSAKHEAVMRKAAAVVRARGHEGDARLADSLLGVLASLQRADKSGEVGSDTAMIDWLEAMANKPEGLLLHDGGDFTGRCGLGLRRIGRTLRQAISKAMSASAAPTEQGDL